MKVMLLQNQNVPVSYPVCGSYRLFLPVFHAVLNCSFPVLSMPLLLSFGHEISEDPISGKCFCVPGSGNHASDLAADFN
jgi:hypothetical protein